jgi:predicted dehydrogenase
MEAFHYRFHAMFHRALELVREGRLGVILRAYACFDAEIDRSPDALRWDPAQGGGATMDLGCYALHALRTLIAEEPALVAARAVLESGVDAEMSAELAFPGGVTAQVHCSMIKPVSNILVIEGERATLRLDLFVLPQLGGELSLSGVHENLKEVAHGPTSYEAQLAHVAEVMRGEREPLTGGTDAVANMAIIDAMRLAVGMGVG